MPTPKRPPAFQFYPDAWFGSIAVEMMPAEVEGTYIRLLARQWQAVTLPADPAALRLLTKLSPAQWRKAWPLLAPHFPEVDGGRQNPTLHAVHEERQEFLAKQADNGRKGGRPKKTQAFSLGSDSLNPNESSVSGSGSGSLTTRNIQEVVDIPSPPALVVPWVHPSGHEALAALFATVPDVAGWVGLFRGLAQGTTLGRPVSPLRLALAVQEFVASGRHRDPQGPNPKLFQGFVKRAKEPEAASRQPTDAERKADQLREIRERNEWCRRALLEETPEPFWAAQIDAMFPDGRTFPAGVAA